MFPRLVEKVLHDRERRLQEDGRAVRILNKPTSSFSMQMADVVTSTVAASVAIRARLDAFFSLLEHTRQLCLATFSGKTTSRRTWLDVR